MLTWFIFVSVIIVLQNHSLSLIIGLAALHNQCSSSSRDGGDIWGRVGSNKSSVAVQCTGRSRADFPRPRLNTIEYKGRLIECKQLIQSMTSPRWPHLRYELSRTTWNKSVCKTCQNPTVCSKRDLCTLQKKNYYLRIKWNFNSIWKSSLENTIWHFL